MSFLRAERRPLFGQPARINLTEAILRQTRDDLGSKARRHGSELELVGNPVGRAPTANGKFLVKTVDQLGRLGENRWLRIERSCQRAHDLSGLLLFAGHVGDGTLTRHRRRSMPKT